MILTILINYLLWITRHKDRSTRGRPRMYFICWREKTETEDTCSKICWVLSHQKWGSTRSFYWSHQSSDEEATNCKKSLQFSLVYSVLKWALNMMWIEFNIGSIQSDNFQDINIQVKLSYYVANGCHSCEVILLETCHSNFSVMSHKWSTALFYINSSFNIYLRHFEVSITIKIHSVLILWHVPVIEMTSWGRQLEEV